ncbi:MAG: type II toxin-antitoxin system VapB family antitoxin [Magnetococcales bacterium]|nr:type II toxin-antitoxin system VapB family antitoxin [Magnetococcales bacterium]
MSILIESDEACQLAIDLVGLTGEDLTQAITESIRERLLRIQQAHALADDLMTIGHNCAVRLKEPYRSADHGDLLYDERGIPS